MDVYEIKYALDDVTPERLARLMHESYEGHARRVGWETQDSCRVAFDDLPEENRRTMLAVAGDVLEFLRDELRFFKRRKMWEAYREDESFFPNFKENLRIQHAYRKCKRSMGTPPRIVDAFRVTFTMIYYGCAAENEARKRGQEVM